MFFPSTLRRDSVWKAASQSMQLVTWPLSSVTLLQVQKGTRALCAIKELGQHSKLFLGIKRFWEKAVSGGDFQ